MMHRIEDVEVAMEDVTFVPGVLFDLGSFNFVQEKHDIIVDNTVAHMPDGRVD